MQNGLVESFNGRLRDECLNEHLFANLNEARQNGGMEDQLQHPAGAHTVCRHCMKKQASSSTFPRLPRIPAVQIDPAKVMTITRTIRNTVIVVGLRYKTCLHSARPI
ncbi:MAG: hypothetical protein EPO23_06505 [Xanthobacteraceae bacterium]|nr:MAG: hypothetical protein EPO23_06505 [Xanthobacteraceae bacterium]